MPWTCPACKGINGDPVLQCSCNKFWKCPSCGNVNTGPPAQCECGYVQQNKVDDKTLEANPRYKGIGGWLLFLCIILTVLSPLHTLRDSLRVWGELRPALALGHFDVYSMPYQVFWILFALDIGLTFLGIYAGIALWTIRRNAISIAMTFFALSLGYSILATFLLLLADFPFSGGFIMWDMVSFAIWVSYLAKSKRVKATYGA